MGYDENDDNDGHVKKRLIRWRLMMMMILNGKYF